MAVSDPCDDEAWFRSVYHATYRPLLAYVRRRVHPALADEIVSDTFLTAWRRRDDVPDGAERLWLFGIARNVIRNARRASARSRAAEARLQLMRPPQVDDSAAFPASAAQERSDLLRAALDALPEADREVLMLVAWEELSHAEIGQLLGISANASAIRVHRARKRLAARLGRLERAAAGDSAAAGDPEVKALRDSGQVEGQVEGQCSVSPADAWRGNAGPKGNAP